LRLGIQNSSFKIQNLKKHINGTTALQYFNLLRFGTTILLMIILAKFLPQEDIAVYEMFWFTTSMLSFFWVASSINAALTYLPKLNVQESKKALFNIFLFFTAVSILMSGILYLSADWFTSTFGMEEELPYIPLLCLFLVFQTPSWLVQIFYLLLKKYKEIFIYGTIAFSLQIIAVLVPVLMGFGLEEIFIGLILMSAVKFIWLLVLIMRHTTFSVDFQMITPFYALALPLVLKAFLNRGYESIDGLIVNSHFQDETAFAVFRYGAREMPYVTLFIGAIVTALLPKMASNLESGMQNLKEQTFNLSKWMFPLSALFMLTSPWVFERAFSPEFRDSAYVFNVYLLMLSSRILLPQTVVMAKEKSYFLLFSAAIEIIVNVTLSLLFVRIFGLLGIAFASVIAFYVNKINQMVYLKTKHGISPHQYIAVRPHFAFSAFLYGSFVLSLFLHGQV
jgi:O-antigen/teichoic acid export membrane protein